MLSESREGNIHVLPRATLIISRPEAGPKWKKQYTVGIPREPGDPRNLLFIRAACLLLILLFLFVLLFFPFLTPITTELRSTAAYIRAAQENPRAVATFSSAIKSKYVRV